MYTISANLGLTIIAYVWFHLCLLIRPTIHKCVIAMFSLSVCL